MFSCYSELVAHQIAYTHTADDKLGRHHSCTEAHPLADFRWNGCHAPHSRLLWSLNAIGTSGVMMMPQVLGTSTSRIALRFTFLRTDLGPKVASSLPQSVPGRVLHLRFLISGRLPNGGDSPLPRSEDCVGIIVSAPSPFSTMLENRIQTFMAVEHWVQSKLSSFLVMEGLDQ